MVTLRDSYHCDNAHRYKQRWNKHKNLEPQAQNYSYKYSNGEKDNHNLPLLLKGAITNNRLPPPQVPERVVAMKAKKRSRSAAFALFYGSVELLFERLGPSLRPAILDRDGGRGTVTRRSSVED
jgi:hypothetical protein